MTYTETVEPVNVPNSPLSRIPIPCQPMPRLRTCAGGGVALARRDAALYAPVDCQSKDNLSLCCYQQMIAL